MLQALNVFDGAVAAVTSLMKSELYPRFIKSDQYTRLARGVAEKRLAIETAARASLSTNEQPSPLASPSGSKGARTNSATMPPSPSTKSSVAASHALPPASAGDKKAAPAAAAPAAAAADSKKPAEPALLMGLKKWVNHKQFFKVCCVFCCFLLLFAFAV